MPHLRKLPASVLVIAVMVVAAAITSLLTLLRSPLTSVHVSQEARRYESDLLPTGWHTYVGNGWSMGYPEEWTAGETTGGMFFAPPTVDNELLPPGDFLQIIEDDTVPEREATTAQQESIVASDFLFAGYPATKYTFEDRAMGDGREVIYVHYNDRIFEIATDHPTYPEVGIMLATFQFIE